MMLDDLRAYCLAKPGVTEDTPFGPHTLVFRVAGKVFALTSLDDPGSVNLKCDPERAAELREQHPGIIPGYHMNKRHWNTVSTRGDVPKPLIRELVDHSYELVRGTLSKKVQAELGVDEPDAERGRHGYF
ncbi:MAG: MmcQ/YjbR family DNA-binding protein [Flavobacteriales bacterium]